MDVVVRRLTSASCCVVVVVVCTGQGSGFAQIPDEDRNLHLIARRNFTPTRRSQTP